MADPQAGYQRLEQSERRPSPEATLIGPADENETFQVTIILRRRTDGAKVPDYSEIHALSTAHRAGSPEEFAEKYGAAPEEMAQVEAFARANGLTVDESHPARRSVRVSGTVAQMSKAFAVTLSKYQRPSTPPERVDLPAIETYRGRDGFISVPATIAPFIVGVFGLDNRNVTHRSMGAGDPTNTVYVTVPQVRTLYGFPTNSAAGQTIAVFSEGGYAATDIQKYFAHLGLTTPTVTPITVDASNGSPDGETTQDVCIAASAAPGAAVAVYFTTYDQKGWVDAINRLNVPNAGDPHCSVMSNSFYVLNGDDQAVAAGASNAWVAAVSAAYKDSALQGITHCIASGDTGAQSKVSDGKAHVQYPVSDPGVLGCGGTTIGSISGTTFTEWVWNDTFNPPFSGTGATGGGVSAYFAQPAYQSTAHVPVSLFNGKTGRGVPDVAANSSPDSGYYPVYVNGNPSVGNGTSASAPLYAGLIAVMNAALGARIGFLNTTLYELGTSVTRNISGPPGPANNSLAGTTGYPASAGWNACCGWGVLNGPKLIAALKGSLGAPSAGVLGAPFVGKDLNGRLEVFVVGKNGSLWHNAQTAPSGPWGGWAAVVAGTPLSSGPARVIANADGRLEIFGMSGGLWHIWQTTPSGSWSAGASLGSPSSAIIGNIGVAKNKSGALEVFGVGQDGQLHHIWQTTPGGGWSAWASLAAPSPGLSIGDPRVVVNADGRLEVFVQAKDQKIWHVWQTAPSGGWSAWVSLAGPAVAISNGAPFVGVNADGRIEMFVTGGDGNIYHIYQTAPGAGWSAWSLLAAHPAAAQLFGLGAITNNQNGAFQIFTIGSDGSLWTIAQTAPSNGWGPWVSLGGAPPSKQLNGDQAPAYGLNSDGDLAAFVLGEDGAVWELSE